VAAIMAKMVKDDKAIGQIVELYGYITTLINEKTQRVLLQGFGSIIFRYIWKSS
jgi:hypothetical protein